MTAEKGRSEEEEEEGVEECLQPLHLGGKRSIRAGGVLAAPTGACRPPWHEASFTTDVYQQQSEIEIPRVLRCRQRCHRLKPRLPAGASTRPRRRQSTRPVCLLKIETEIVCNQH